MEASHSGRASLQDTALERRRSISLLLKRCRSFGCWVLSSPRGLVARVIGLQQSWWTGRSHPERFGIAVVGQGIGVNLWTVLIHLDTSFNKATCCGCSFFCFSRDYVCMRMGRFLNTVNNEYSDVAGVVLGHQAPTAPTASTAPARAREHKHEHKHNHGHGNHHHQE